MSLDCYYIGPHMHKFDEKFSFPESLQRRAQCAPFPGITGGCGGGYLPPLYVLKRCEICGMLVAIVSAESELKPENPAPDDCAG